MVKDDTTIRVACGATALFVRLLTDRSGNILMITGLTFLFLVGIGGAGYDLGRQQLIRQKLQQASDVAVLGAAGMEGATAQQREDTANILFQLNFPDTYMGIARPTPVITVVPDANVSLVANVNVDTSFIGNFNIETVPAKSRSIAQINTTVNKIDVVLVMDNSGSMGINYDVGAVNTLSGGPGLRARCIIGWMAYLSINAQQATGYCNDWEGATGANRLNALRYVANKFIGDLMEPNPNDHRAALITWDAFVIETRSFTNDPAPLKNFIRNNMYGRGSTNSTQGLNQANAMVPAFRSNAVHAVVLMTDGENYPNANAQNAASLQVCNQLKQEPRTLVFTIIFGSTASNSSVRQFLSDCATGPNGNGQPNLDLYFFAAPDASKLQEAFNTIAGTLQRVRILQ